MIAAAPLRYDGNLRERLTDFLVLFRPPFSDQTIRHEPLAFAAQKRPHRAQQAPKTSPPRHLTKAARQSAVSEAAATSDRRQRQPNCRKAAKTKVHVRKREFLEPQVLSQFLPTFVWRQKWAAGGKTSYRHGKCRKKRVSPPERRNDSRPLSGPPIVPLPRKRLASSAAGGASPLSPARQVP